LSGFGGIADMNSSQGREEPPFRPDGIGLNDTAARSAGCKAGLHSLE
jgi:hypothetical protein